MLQSQIRTTSEGVEVFQLAVRLLSDEGVDFRVVDGGTDNGSVVRRDSMQIVKSYFRLLKCALEPPPNTPSNNTPMADEEWIKMACDLLKRLGDLLKTALQGELSSLQDLNGTQPAPQQHNRQLEPSSVRAASNRRNKTILHYLSQILTAIHPHLHRSARILGPAHRSLCDVSDLFTSVLELERGSFRRMVKVIVPIVGWTALRGVQEDVVQLDNAWIEANRWFARGACSLFGLLDGTLEHICTAALQRGRKELVVPVAHEKQSKIIVFLMARIMGLIGLVRRRRGIDSDGLVMELEGGLIINNNNTQEEKEEQQLMSSCILRLIKMRTFAAIAQGFIEDESTTASKDRNQRALFDMLAGLGPRAETYLTKLLQLGDVSAKNTRVVQTGVRCFMDLPVDTDCSSVLSTGGENNVATCKLEHILPLGKLILVKHLIKHLNNSSLNQQQQHSNSSALIGLCESILFVDIPNCHHFLKAISLAGCEIQNWVTKVFCDIVGCLENATHVFFCDWGDSGRNNAIVRQHHLLLRWLAPSSSSRPNHPLTNEMLMCVVQTRILASCSLGDGYSKQDVGRFISFMSQLVFHQQTETCHRRIIAMLLVRLLSSSGATTTVKQPNWGETAVLAKTKTLQFMWKELSKSTIFGVVDDTSKKKRTGKRKRSEESKNANKSIKLPAEEALTICWLLEVMAKMAVSSQSGIDSAVFQSVKQLWDGILDNKSSKAGNKHMQLYLLSLSNGAMQGSQSFAAFILALGVERQPGSFIDSCLTFVDKKLQKCGRSNNTSLLRVCLSFISALVGLLGSDLSESHIGRVGAILKKLRVHTSGSTPAQSFGLQHALVSTVSKMGPCIRAEFSTETLQVSVGVEAVYCLCL